MNLVEKIMVGEETMGSSSALMDVVRLTSGRNETTISAWGQPTRDPLNPAATQRSVTSVNLM